MGKYDDIIDLPHHVSKVHPQMSIWDRSAQFAPFAALTGHDAAIKETARLTDERLELRIALSMLQPLQRERLMKNVCCGLSSRAIAKQEGVYYSSVDKSIAAAKKNFIKFYENL